MNYVSSDQQDEKHPLSETGTKFYRGLIEDIFFGGKLENLGFSPHSKILLFRNASRGFYFVFVNSIQLERGLTTSLWLHQICFILQKAWSEQWTCPFSYIYEKWYETSQLRWHAATSVLTSSITRALESQEVLHFLRPSETQFIRK